MSNNETPELMSGFIQSNEKERALMKDKLEASRERSSRDLLREDLREKDCELCLNGFGLWEGAVCSWCGRSGNG